MLTVIAPTSRSLPMREVPAYSSAVFRILFGLLGVYGAARFVAKGWVDQLYLEPTNHLTYRHLDWVQPVPGAWMYFVMAALGLSALALAVGFHGRLAAVAYLLLFTYVELLDAALYLNHYWWVSLAAGWMIVLPVHRTWALSNVWGPGAGEPLTHVPVLTVWILRAQLGVVYFFAGLAKLNADWLIDGNPLNIWLSPKLWEHQEFGVAASWAGMLFDCTIVAWLLWPRSRTFAYMAVVVFHTVTGLLFQIGLFPIVMIAGTLVFFEPEWPRRLLRLGPGSSPEQRSQTPQRRTPTVGAVLLGIVVVLQLVVPLRHFAQPGNVRWNEDGYYLSWRVMLTEKTGYLRFEVTDPATGERWRVRPEAVLTDWQARQASIRSDLLLHTAHLIAQDFADRGYSDVEVRADSFVSFNTRRRQRYADPDIDLASLSRGVPASDWIIPLDEPLYD